MADDTHHVLWCFIKGDSTAFEVPALDKTSIAEVKRWVWEEGKNGILSGTDAKDLVLWKVSTELLADSSQLTSYS
jgi:Crinkler effector protein N-terminal domain